MKFDPRLLAVRNSTGTDMTVIVSCAALMQDHPDALTIASILEVDPELIRIVMDAAVQIGLAKEAKKVAAKADREAKATRLPEGWKLPPESVDYARRTGFSDQKIREMAIGFRNHHQAKGSRMVDWLKAWQTWVQNEAKWNGKRVPDEPGLLAALPPAPPPDTMSGTYRLAVGSWKKSRTWPHGLGPEPGEPGCKVPAEILREFGIA